MNAPASEPRTVHADSPRPAGHARLRFEIIFASVWLAFGLFLLPAAIFLVGGGLLGPYGENGTMGTFYGDFFADLAEPSVRAWALALGPLVLVSLVRLVFAGVGGPTPDADVPVRKEPAAPKRGANPPRVEPRIGAE